MNNFKLLIFLPKNYKMPDAWKSFSPNIELQNYDSENMLEPIKIVPDTIICVSAPQELATNEVAQTLRMSYPTQPIYFVTDEKVDYDKKQLLKNGFTQAFLLPWEKQELASAMELEMVFSLNPEMRDYRPVKTVDFYPDMVLPFDSKVFMPKNAKFITFGREGESLSEQKLSQLRTNNLNTLYVHQNDIEKFQTYIANALLKLGRTGPSETDKEKTLREGIRALVSEMFVENSKENTFKQSQLLLEDLRKSVRRMIGESHQNILSKLENMIGQESDFYGHLSRVSMYSTLFGIILEMPKPEELGVAGLLHDIGFTALPGELIETPYEDLSPTLNEAYHQHSEKSLEIIKMKRMVISDTVQKAIAQHHERLDRQGYPFGLAENKIIPESQILAIADQFDYLTSARIGKETLRPIAALNFLLNENTKDPVRRAVEPSLIRKIIEKMQPKNSNHYLNPLP